MQAGPKMALHGRLRRPPSGKGWRPTSQNCRRNGQSCAARPAVMIGRPCRSPTWSFPPTVVCGSPPLAIRCAALRSHHTWHPRSPCKSPACQRVSRWTLPRCSPHSSRSRTRSWCRMTARRNRTNPARPLLPSDSRSRGCSRGRKCRRTLRRTLRRMCRRTLRRTHQATRRSPRNRCLRRGCASHTFGKSPCSLRAVGGTRCALGHAGGSRRQVPALRGRRPRQLRR